MAVAGFTVDSSLTLDVAHASTPTDINAVFVSAVAGSVVEAASVSVAGV
jgi:hypothetical protein